MENRSRKPKTKHRNDGKSSIDKQRISEDRRAKAEARGIQLDTWQKEVMEYEGDLLLCTGRRVGKTMIMSYKACERLVKKPKTEIVVVSLTEDQAKLIIEMCREYLELYYKKLIAKGKKKPTQSSIILTNGSKIISRPVGNTGDAIRGFNGDILIVDEASRMPELMWLAAKPILLTTGGEIWMCSTPHGKQGYFWEQFEKAYIKKDPDARFKVFYKSSEDVVYNRKISPSWTEEDRKAAIRVLEEEKKDMSELQYGQEYLGLFLDELRQYFTDEWIDKVCSIKEEELKANADYFLGVDIARLGGDETAFAIIRRKSRSHLIHVYIETAVKKLTTWTEDKILELDRKYRFRKIYIDAGSGSLGVGIFDQLLRHPQTKRKVEAINSRKIVLDREGKTRQKLLKEDLYDNLRILGERNEIFLLDNEKVRASLKSIQYEYITRQKGISQMRIFGNYTHIAEALIRAAWCSKEKIINMNLYYI